MKIKNIIKDWCRFLAYFIGIQKKFIVMLLLLAPFSSLGTVNISIFFFSITIINASLYSTCVSKKYIF